MHPKLLPKKFKDKEKKDTIATIQQDLGLDIGDETKIIAMRRKGISNSRSSSSIQSSTLESDNNEWKQSDLFHIRVITKHTKIDSLFDSGSQVNLISKAIVKKLGLDTKPHINHIHWAG